MPRSYDSRKHPGGPRIEPGGGRALRGARRIGPIRGVTPGDDVEVAREIARLWEWHYRIERMARRALNDSEDGFKVVNGRGGCFYESAVMRSFSDSTKSRYWPLNEASGPFVDVALNLAASPSGGVTQGVKTNPPFLQEPDVQYATFDGVNDKAATAAEAFGNFSGVGKFTVIAFVRPVTGFTGGTIISRISGVDGWFLRVNSSRKLEISRRGGAAQLTSDTALALNVWSFVAVTYDGNRLRLYVNGQHDRDGVDTTSATSVPSAVINIGSKVASDYFKGSLVHVGFKNGIAMSKKTLEDFMVCADGDNDVKPAPVGLIEDATVPVDTTQFGVLVGRVPGIHQILSAGWVPIVRFMGTYTDTNQTISVYLRAETTPGTYETLGISTGPSSVTPPFLPMKFDVWRQMAVSGTPTDIHAEGRFQFVFRNHSILLSRTFTGWSAFIDWTKPASGGSNVVIPPDATVITGEAVDEVAVYNGSNWEGRKLVNANVDAAAAIAYAKLNLATSIVNADIAAGAAIAKSKLAPLAIVNADVDAAAAIAKSKLAPLAIVNADVDVAAAIAKSKLAALNIVNADVDAAAAIAQPKLAFDAWAAYTPALTGSVSNPTLGAGAIQKGRFVQLGKSVLGRAIVQVGSAGFVNGTGVVFIGLPVAARVLDSNEVLGSGWIFDSSAGVFWFAVVEAEATDGNKAFVRVSNETSSAVQASYALPFVWAASDIIDINFMYEAA